MTPQRIAEELELLRSRWPDLEYREPGRWVLLPRYSTPDTCIQDQVAIVFQIKAQHPGDAPYGFYVRKPIERQDGRGFLRTTDAKDPPFEGPWVKFSWRPVEWRPAATAREGSNLYDWALTFWERLAEDE